MSLLQENMNFELQFQELREKVPIYARVLIAAGVNERNIKRNKLKTKDSLIPALMSAAGMILTRSWSNLLIRSPSPPIKIKRIAKVRAFGPWALGPRAFGPCIFGP